MNEDRVELSVAQTPDRSADRMHEAGDGGEASYGTHGDVREDYEAMIDQEGGRIAAARLREIHSGGVELVSAEHVARDLGL
ncbi:antitoxin of toxin-antitoxin stability system [Spiractinospora alimapuensis]|uniref:antitoxin of toxin-antitoxin stability system n=1 Tax=Spiractinospora alimapuensis TaxID=2820884 RepID=UPI001F24DBFB|nr:antitoxin of toxin-antitoxin stability system [Spiractinospora alimapuensis]QVQ49993.1 antitoxin of toxin-antitoxin stability system [Spiractinospora alimapuensis]